jgi:hypothetical protein
MNANCSPALLKILITMDNPSIPSSPEASPSLPTPTTDSLCSTKSTSSCEIISDLLITSPTNNTVEDLLDLKELMEDTDYDLLKQKREHRKAALAYEQATIAFQQAQIAMQQAKASMEKKALDVSRASEAQRDARALAREVLMSGAQQVAEQFTEWKGRNELELLAARLRVEELEERKEDIECLDVILGRFVDGDVEVDEKLLLGCLAGCKPVV